MKVASAVWNPNHVFKTPDEYYKQILTTVTNNDIQIVVFPALLGNLFECSTLFINKMKQLSRHYNNIFICPGSYWENVNNKLFHSSFLMKNGEIILKQRQLYLAKWEQKAGLCRGINIPIIRIHHFNIAIVLSTDLFYPQVSRYVGLNGANLILAPSAILGHPNFPTQISGLWQNVQQNLFFAIESGYKGEYRDHPFHSESIIHAPLEITPNGDGFLARESKEHLLISTTIHFNLLTEAKKHFNPIRQLHNIAYEKLFLS